MQLYKGGGGGGGGGGVGGGGGGGGGGGEDTEFTVVRLSSVGWGQIGFLGFLSLGWVGGSQILLFFCLLVEFILDWGVPFWMGVGGRDFVSSILVFRLSSFRGWGAETWCLVFRLSSVRGSESFFWDWLRGAGIATCVGASGSVQC